MMQDAPDTTFAQGRAPLWSRENLKRVTAAAPMIRYVPKHPAFLLGALVVGVAGTLAWRNRQKIAARARPLIEDAAARGGQLREKLPERLRWSRSAGTPAGLQENLHEGVH